MNRLALLLFVWAQPCLAADYASHTPMRPLPTPSKRPLEKGPNYFVDAHKGADGNDGTEAKPWKTIQFAANRLKPGDTLLLRAGTFYETVRVKAAGTKDRPITIRSYPGELAILDGGLREFFDNPAHAWEPVGTEGEFRSTGTYPQGGSFANFGDSMVPLHRYLHLTDLRSKNEYWFKGMNDRQETTPGLYCGPGVRRDPETGRIHVRLAHTKLPGLGESGYRGETDPRKLPLVVSGHDFTLRIEGASHLRVFDLVVRGGSRGAISISEDSEDCENDSEEIHLEGLTFYGSDMALHVRRTKGLKLLQCALHGHAAPWHSRAHHKYRAHAGYLVMAGGDDFEFGHCDFTDHHDALQIFFVNTMRIHHCWLDNFNDDGIEPGHKKERGKILIYQNLLTRILSPFTLHAKPGEKAKPIPCDEGSGVYIFRNVVDLRKGTYRSIPQEAPADGSFLDSLTEGVAHDHGSPTWPNYYVYHNTFLLKSPEKRGNYGFRWGTALRDNQRRVFNNIFIQEEGLPAFRIFPAATDDFQADGNLHWAIKEGANFQGDLFLKFRKSPVLEASKKTYPPGWFANDRFADPKFVAYGPETRSLDLRLQKGSPALKAGVEIPMAWEDPLRGPDARKPDIGALPSGAEPFQAGRIRK